MKKTCTACLKELEKSDFHKNKATKDGRCYICKTCNYQRSREWKDKNRERSKDHHLKRKYGLTYADYGVLLAEQKGGCAICFLQFDKAPRGVLFVDHCHTTGKVRGLLCANCNTAIGLLLDSPLLMIRAASYLSKHNLKGSD